MTRHRRSTTATSLVSTCDEVQRRAWVTVLYGNVQAFLCGTLALGATLDAYDMPGHAKIVVVHSLEPADSADNVTEFLRASAWDVVWLPSSLLEEASAKGEAFGIKGFAAKQTKLLVPHYLATVRPCLEAVAMIDSDILLTGPLRSDSIFSSAAYADLSAFDVPTMYRLEEGVSETCTLSGRIQSGLQVTRPSRILQQELVGLIGRLKGVNMSAELAGMDQQQLNGGEQASRSPATGTSSSE